MFETFVLQNGLKLGIRRLDRQLPLSLPAPPDSLVNWAVRLAAGVCSELPAEQSQLGFSYDLQIDPGKQGVRHCGCESGTAVVSPAPRS